MKKFLRFMSLLLIVPVLGIGSLLTGCKKEEASINDIRNTYNNMVEKYFNGSKNSTTRTGMDYTDPQTNETKPENTLFSYSGNIEKNAEGEFDYFGSGSKYDINFQISMNYLSTETNGVTSSAGDLYTRYYQLQSVYAELLNYSNSYFARYQKSFFVESSADSIDKKALHKLLGKLENLEDEVENFNAHLNDRESLAEFLGADTKVMTTKLDTFNSVFIDLINANFEFVLEFCNVHKTYVLNADKVDASLIVNDVISERLIYEASLKYAYAYFLDNILSLRNNGLCTTVGLENPAKTNANIKEKVDSVFDKMYSNSYWNLKVSENDSDETKAKKVEALKYYIPLLEQAIVRFDKFTELYKVNVSNFDMFTYAQLRIVGENSNVLNNTMYSKLSEFEDSLSAENTARLKVIEDYISYDAGLLYKSLNNILTARV